MESKKRVKLEIELIKSFGFKRKWAGDKSAYWFTKHIKYKDFYLQLLVDTFDKLLILEVKTGSYWSGKIDMYNYYDSVKKYPLTINNIKMLIKKYK